MGEPFYHIERINLETDEPFVDGDRVFKRKSEGSRRDVE